MCHVINGLWRSVNGARDARIPSCTARKILEIGSRLVFITLDTIAAHRYVLINSCPVIIYSSNKIEAGSPDVSWVSVLDNKQCDIKA